MMFEILFKIASALCDQGTGGTIEPHQVLVEETNGLMELTSLDLDRSNLGCNAKDEVVFKVSSSLILISSLLCSSSEC